LHFQSGGHEVRPPQAYAASASCPLARRTRVKVAGEWHIVSVVNKGGWMISLRCCRESDHDVDVSVETLEAQHTDMIAYRLMT